MFLSFILSSWSAIPLAAQDKMQPSTVTFSEVPEEVVVKGESGERMKTARPRLEVKADNFDSIRRSLGPDRELLRYESADFKGPARSNPDTLASEKMIRPWRAAFSDKAVIAFHPLKKYEETFKEKQEKDGKGEQWTLTVTDEDGRLFHRYAGKGLPPETINWNGENDNKEWLRAGRSYAPLYVFTDAKGVATTVTGEIIKFTAIVYQKDGGTVIGLDSASLFGPDKSMKAVEKPQGENLLSSTADLVKRKYYGQPAKVVVYAHTRELALAQAGAIRELLKEKLMAPDALITTDGAEVPFPLQRADIVLAGK